MEFKGPNYFLSNSFQSPFDYEIDGVTYRFQNAEAAFQAERSPNRAGEFVGLTAKEAKDLGKKMKKKDVRPDFNDVRIDIMEKVLAKKFSSPALQARLLSIKDSITMDVNYMDIYWGLYNGRGQNNMGKCLTKVRDNILREKGLLVEKESNVCCYKIQQGGMVTFDTETTGLSGKYDDILQITIAGQNGEILLSTYVKPQNCTSWEDSMEIHHITPEMVKDAPTADKVASIVKQIFDNADMIVGYNVGFDVKMVANRFGYEFDENKIIDALPLFRQYLKENLEKTEGRACYKAEDGSVVQANLSSAVKVLLGNQEYIIFESEAHDAEADTIETAKVMKKLAEIYDIDIPSPRSMGVENLFGIEEGILCNQVNSKGIVTDGFTKRLFYHHPEAKEVFKKAFQSCRKQGVDPFGKASITPCNEKPNVSIANIYAQKQVGNAEIDGKEYTDVPTLCECIGKICDTYKDKPVYLPCIMSSNTGDFKVVDAIGCGKSGGKWENIRKGLDALNKDNIFLVDTTTGRCEPLNRDKSLQIAPNKDENDDIDEDFEIC